MSKIEKMTCDACETEITENKMRLRVDCWPPLIGYLVDRDTRVAVAEVKLRELRKTRKDFCSLECLSRWAISQSRLEKQRAYLGE